MTKEPKQQFVLVFSRTSYLSHEEPERRIRSSRPEVYLWSRETAKRIYYYRKGWGYKGRVWVTSCEHQANKAEVIFRLFDSEEEALAAIPASLEAAHEEYTATRVRHLEEIGQAGCRLRDATIDAVKAAIPDWETQ